MSYHRVHFLQMLYFNSKAQSLAADAHSSTHLVLANRPRFKRELCFLLSVCSVALPIATSGFGDEWR